MKYMRNNKIRVHRDGKIEKLVRGEYVKVKPYGKYGYFSYYDDIPCSDKVLNIYGEAFLGTRRVRPIDGDYYNVSPDNIELLVADNPRCVQLYEKIDLVTGEVTTGERWEIGLDVKRLHWALQTNNIVKHYYVRKK